MEFRLSGSGLGPGDSSLSFGDSGWQLQDFFLKAFKRQSLRCRGYPSGLLMKDLSSMQVSAGL